jgi:DNA-binding Lrp family transcriptional regulator
MKELKSLDLELLWELVKNSRRSDRQLAKALKTSQPTVTRRRAKLEKEFIEGYTAIPKWEKIGFELVAFTVVKTNRNYAKRKKGEPILSEGREWLMKQPNVIFALAGEGMEWDGLIISYHTNYSDYTEFKVTLDEELSPIVSESRSFIAANIDKYIIKPFHFKYLANAK